jgi:hypothetical protein
VIASSRSLPENFEILASIVLEAIRQLLARLFS